MYIVVVYQVVGFFDVAARLCAGNGPIAASVGGASRSIGYALQHRVHLMTKNNITVQTFNEHVRRKMRRRCPVTFMKAEKMLLVSLQHKIR